jgi:hypothetical protein
VTSSRPNRRRKKRRRARRRAGCAATARPSGRGELTVWASIAAILHATDSSRATGQHKYLVNWKSIFVEFGGKLFQILENSRPLTLTIREFSALYNG